jgi:hypothetical protein
MKSVQKAMLVGAGFLATVMLMLALHTGLQQPAVQPPYPQPPFQHQTPPPELQPKTPNISNPVPSHQSYQQIIAQLKEWQREAPDLVSEVGVYGKTSRGQDIYFVRVGNMYKRDKLKVLLYGCIHGNEPISTSTMMAFVGTLLSKYGADDTATQLLDTREIVLVPVVSPDSYPNSRHVDGVDPNRDFPSKRNLGRVSVPPIKALQDFHKQEQFRAALLGHSWGRWLLYPWSEIYEPCSHDAQYRDITKRMADTSGYKPKKSSDFYPGRTIVGGGCDWFYRNGCFALTPEFGTHQRKSTDEEIRYELDLVYEAFVLFIREAPKIEVPVTDPQVFKASNPRISAAIFDDIPD